MTALIISTAVIVYSGIGFVIGFAYGFGNNTTYNNAKSFFIGLLWPLSLVIGLLMIFWYWISQRD